MLETKDSCSSGCRLTLGVLLLISGRAFRLEGDSSCTGCLRFGDSVLESG